jgi:hypothetical protein
VSTSTEPRASAGLPMAQCFCSLKAHQRGLASWPSLISLGSGQARPLLKDYSGTFLACEWTPDSKHLIAEALVDTRVKLAWQHSRFFVDQPQGWAGVARCCSDTG